MVPSLRRAVRAARAYGPSLLDGIVAPAARFLILSPGRAGSELLVDLLDSQPGVRCDSEILSQDVRWPVQWTRAHAARAGLRGHRAYGFKLLVGQLQQVGRRQDRAGLVRTLAGGGWLVIGLTRRDLLRQAVSWVRAEEQDEFHQRSPRLPAPRPVTLEPEQAIAMMVLVEEANSFIGRTVAGLRHLELTYEDDLADAARHQATVERVMSALDLPAAPVTTRLVPTSPPTLAESVANYDELAGLLRQTRFAAFLDEG